MNQKHILLWKTIINKMKILPVEIKNRFELAELEKLKIDQKR